jgi:hypothetical protein
MPWEDLKEISDDSASWFKPEGGNISVPSLFSRSDESTSSGSSGPRLGTGVGSVEQDASAGGPRSQVTSLDQDDKKMVIDDEIAASRLQPQKPLPLPRQKGQSSLGHEEEEMDADEKGQGSSRTRPLGLQTLGPRGSQSSLNCGEGGMDVDEESVVQEPRNDEHSFIRNKLPSTSTNPHSGRHRTVGDGADSEYLTQEQPTPPPQPFVEFTQSRSGRRVVKNTYVESSDDEPTHSEEDFRLSRTRRAPLKIVDEEVPVRRKSNHRSSVIAEDEDEKIHCQYPTRKALPFIAY